MSLDLSRASTEQAAHVTDAWQQEKGEKKTLTLRHSISREIQTRLFHNEVCRQEKVRPSPVSQPELVGTRLFCFAALLTFNRPNMEQEVGPSQITGKQISGKCTASRRLVAPPKKKVCSVIKVHKENKRDGGEFVEMKSGG